MSEANMPSAESSPYKPLTALHVKGTLLTYDAQEAFYKATLLNARNSILEEGVVRFDLLRNIDDANQFLLVEVYKDANDHGKHRLTKHFNDWRSSVEPFMAVERTVTRYETVYPLVSSWRKPKSSNEEDREDYEVRRPWLAPPLTEQTVSSRSGAEGGLLAQFIDVYVSNERVDEFESFTTQFCTTSLEERGICRIDLLRSIDAPDLSSNSTKFRFVKMFKSVGAEKSHKQSAHFAAWATQTQPLLVAAEMVTESYSTLFPSPLYFH